MIRRDALVLRAGGFVREACVLRAACMWRACGELVAFGARLVRGAQYEQYSRD